MPVMDFETDITIAKWSLQVEWDGTVVPHETSWPLPVLQPFVNTTTLPEFPPVVPGNRDLGVMLQLGSNYHYGLWRGRFDVETAYSVPGSRVKYETIHWQSTNEDLDMNYNPLVDVAVRSRVRTGDLQGGVIQYNPWTHSADDYEHWYQDDNDIIVESGRFLEVECYFTVHMPDYYFATEYEGIYFKPIYFDYHYFDPLVLPEDYYDPGHYYDSYYVPVLHNLTVDFKVGPQPPELLNCVVKDVCAHQIIGTTAVEITYTLQSVYNMTVELQVTDSDGNALGMQPASSELTGDIGINVGPGSCTIYWNIGNSTIFDNQYIEDIRIIVGARSATYPDATCHATSNLLTIDSEDPIIYGIKFEPIVICEEGSNTSLVGKTYFRMLVDTYDNSVIRWVKFEYDVDGTSYHSFYSDEFSEKSPLVYEAIHDFDVEEDGESAFTANSLLYYRVTVQDIWGNDTVVEGSISVLNDPPEAPTGLTIDSIACTYPNTVSVLKTVPTFGWNFNDSNPGDRQGAWQIQVNTEEDFTGFIIWDSGKVQEPLVNGFYQRLDSDGPPRAVFGQEGLHHSLIRCHNFYWRVKTWDMHDAEGIWSGPCKFYVEPVTVDVSRDIPFRLSYGVLPPKITYPKLCEQLTTLVAAKGTVDISAWSLKYQECAEFPNLVIEVYIDSEQDPVATGSIIIVASDFDLLDAPGGGTLIDGQFVSNGYYGGQVEWSVNIDYQWYEGKHLVYTKVYEVAEGCRSDVSESMTFVIHTAPPTIALKTIATNNKVIGGVVDSHSPIEDSLDPCYNLARTLSILIKANCHYSTGIETSLGEWTSTVTSLIDHSLNNVVVSVENSAGQMTTHTGKIIYETNSPKVYVDNHGVISTRKITGTFIHDGDSDINYSPGISEIRVNGLLATFSETFEEVGSNRISFGTWEVTLNSLLEGPNKVMIEVVDKAGNRSRGYQIVKGEGYVGSEKVLIFLDTHNPTGDVITSSPTNVQVVRGNYNTLGISSIVKVRIRANEGIFVDIL